MNPHIEEFERYAKAYLRWSHFNMDRIVADVVKKHDKPFVSYDKLFPSPLLTIAEIMRLNVRQWFNRPNRPNLFLSMLDVPVDAKIGTQLRIRLPDGKEKLLTVGKP